MLSRKVVKGEQPFFVFFQAVGCFWVLGLVTGDELIIGCQSGFSGRRQIHFVDQLFGAPLNALGHFIQDVGRFMYPATLLWYRAIFFLEREPKAQ
jgi:hypothetical protein